MFRTSVPVSDKGFANREAELARLTEAVRKLEGGNPAWVAILGARKIGKTSLVLELARRQTTPSLRFIQLDALEELPLSLDIFRRLALRALDVAVGAKLGQSLEALAKTPADYRAV